MIIITVHQVTDAWQVAVAIGTLVLAVATFALAFGTFLVVRWTRKTAEASSTSAEAARNAARSAAADVEVSRKALETQVRPVIVGVPTTQRDPQITVHFVDREPITVDCYQVYVGEDERWVHCTVPARNIGAGTAFIRSFELDIGTRIALSGNISLAILPPGEFTRASFSIPKDRIELRDLASAVLQGTFNVRLRYADINSQQETITRLDVHHVESKTYVRESRLFKPNESEPFAWSAATDPHVIEFH